MLKLKVGLDFCQELGNLGGWTLPPESTGQDGASGKAERENPSLGPHVCSFTQAVGTLTALVKVNSFRIGVLMKGCDNPSSLHPRREVRPVRAGSSRVNRPTCPSPAAQPHGPCAPAAARPRRGGPGQPVPRSPSSEKCRESLLAAPDLTCLGALAENSLCQLSGIHWRVE